MIHPRHVNDELLFTRQQAVNALKVSQYSFSKYYAFDHDKHNKYSGAYLNARSKAITGKTVNAIEVATKEMPVFRNNISEIADYYNDQYVVEHASKHTVINIKPNQSVYFRYILPLCKLWMSQKEKPYIVLIDNNENEAFDKYNELINQAKKNNYQINDPIKLFTTKPPIINWQGEQKRDLSIVPVKIWNDYMEIAALPKNKNAQILTLIDMIYNTQWSLEKDKKRQVKIIINDLTTHVLDEAGLMYRLKDYMEGNLSKGIEITLITNRKLPKIIKHTYIKTNISNLPFDDSIRKVIEQ